VCSALEYNPSPKALEIIEAPPTPIDIPNAAIKKETGSTTLIAAIALEPIHWPTKIVSIRILSDITKLPIDAGTACWISNFEIGWLPKASVDLKLIH
jgi:hypothetical protein